MGFLDTLTNESGLILAILFVIAALVIATAPSGMLISENASPGTLSSRNISTYHKIVTKPYTLYVSKSGDGIGNVKSAPRGINCGSDCMENYTSGSRVILIAYPDRNSRFAGWRGCSSTHGAACVARMSDTKKVDAKFILKQKKGGGGELPTVSVSHSPAAPYVNNEVQISIRAYVAEGTRLSSSGLFVDGIKVQPTYCTLPITGTDSNPPALDCTYVTAFTRPGTHTYYGEVTDSNGKTARDPEEGTKSFDVVLSTAPEPTLYAAHSPLSPKINELVEIRAYATDDKEIKEVALFVDNNKVDANCLYALPYSGEDSNGGGGTVNGNATNTITPSGFAILPVPVATANCVDGKTFAESGYHTYYATVMDSDGHSVRYPETGTKGFSVNQEGEIRIAD